LKIFNPDGSQAEKSGNGIRIFSRFLFEKKYVHSKDFSLQTLGGEVQVKILDDEAKMIQVGMGKVTFKSDLIPVSGASRDVVNEKMDFNGMSFHATCLSIGNPHCVIPVEEASKDLALKLGPLVENHERFPRRINMQLLQVLDKSRIKIEIWERGAGYTLASGSSSCAAASAAHKLGLVGPDILVHMPGGNIRICIQEDGQVLMTGSVTAVGQGEFASEFQQLLEKK
jgi:diaminopimelate epimerase